MLQRRQNVLSLPGISQGAFVLQNVAVHYAEFIIHTLLLLLLLLLIIIIIIIAFVNPAAVYFIYYISEICI
jgi:predicted neutral ceramidase superfamily lipid hydrolase